jgi:DNA (cytosine-5)-methyltransferase 1
MRIGALFAGYGGLDLAVQQVWPDDANLWITVRRTEFGQYGPVVARWEQVLGRPAPAPTVAGKDGRARLSPVFVEWMMGLPEGWVTGAGIAHGPQLKALGNGVVPQQAAVAIRLCVARLEEDTE